MQRYDIFLCDHCLLLIQLNAFFFNTYQNICHIVKNGITQYAFISRLPPTYSPEKPLYVRELDNILINNLN